MGLYAMDNSQTLRLIGRLSFPIFAIIYGYHFNEKLNIKLLLYGLPLVVLNYYIRDSIFFNILYSFFIGGFLLNIYNKKLQDYKFDRIIFIALLILLQPFLNIYFDYGFFAFFFMLASSRRNIKSKTAGFILVFFAYYIIQYLHFSFGILNSIVFAILSSIEAVLLYFYKNNTIANNNGPFETYIKLLARYSLEIFIIQAVAFEIYYYLKFLY